MALDHSGNTNCTTELLDNVQATYGPISAQNLLSLDGGKEVNASSFPPNITCTNCNKAIYNELQLEVTNQSNAFDVNDFNTTILISQCGASFIGKALIFREVTFLAHRRK